jgi:hypothetical protein
MSYKKRMDKKQPWLHEEKTPFTFTIWCGNPTPSSNPMKFSWSEMAPKSYCRRKTDKDPGPERGTVHKFISTIIDKHDKELFAAKRWKCAICNCLATKIFYSSRPLLDPPCDCHFEPSVQVFAVPACTNSTATGKNCGQKAMELIDMNEGRLFPEHEPPKIPLICAFGEAVEGDPGYFMPPGYKPGSKPLLKPEKIERTIIRKCTGCNTIGCVTIL